MYNIVLIILFISTSWCKAQEIIPGSYSTDVYFPLLKNKRVAIVANHTSLIKATHLVDTLLSSGINVKKIFSPEHGFRGIAEAGEKVKNEKDYRTGLPIISLYGKHFKPTTSDLHGIDIVLFDIQDVGVRCYTYLSTLHYVMEACAENNIPIIILDRPNPNGFYIDGPVLEKRFKSFVGLHPVPLVYGMTIGEYARMINGEGWLRNSVLCDLTVIPCQGYRHSFKYIPEIPPSPNLRNIKAIYLYPSLVMFEGTVISVGRGTEQPFTCYGHPELTKGDFLFTPRKTGNQDPLYRDTLCIGFNLANYNFPQNTQSYFTLKWLKEAYESYHNKKNFFNRFFNYLVGNEILKKQIEQNLSEEEIRETWEGDIKKFTEIRAKYLLYP